MPISSDAYYLNLVVILLKTNGFLKISLITVRQEVMSEGYQEHFQSLTNIIKSSELVKDKVPHTPKKVSNTPINVPPSPNLEWLNEVCLVC